MASGSQQISDNERCGQPTGCADQLHEALHDGGTQNSAVDMVKEVAHQVKVAVRDEIPSRDAIDMVKAKLHRVKGAIDMVKEGLYKVKVNKYDADQLERKLEKELFDKWDEKCEVVKVTKIPVDKLPAYLNHMQEAYEGIDDTVRKRMDGILFSSESWESQTVEWKFTKGADSGAQYGMMAFGRSPDGEFVDCMYVMYMMDFKIAQERIVTVKKHSVLWGILGWTTDAVSYDDRNLGAVSIKQLQNIYIVLSNREFQKKHDKVIPKCITLSLLILNKD